MSNQEAASRGDRGSGDPNYVSSLGRRFGQIGDFWKRYDRLADQKDEEMSKNLNGNLDVLLIFAGLFSTVNTAFIALSMPFLSPDPSDETNRLLRFLVLRVDNQTLTPADLSPPFSPASTSVIANCFLLSSLCFSLLAAVGAMLGKEWLQNYDRTGQSGPLEAQGRFRQQKYTAAQQWHLEEIVQLLPNVLLLSVLLFFVGLIQLLLPMNKAVAGIVIAFAGLGTLLTLATIVIGSVSPHCPYQGATSRGLRWVGKEVSLKHNESIRMVGQFGSVLASTVEHLFGLPLRRLKETLLSLLVSGRAEDIGGGPSNALVADNDQIDLPFPSKAASDDILNAQAASWLLDVTSNIEDQLAVAQNICNLPVKACEILVQDTDVWRRLLVLTKDALQQWQSQPSDVSLRNIAEQFGVALYHLLAGYPRCSDQWEETCRTLPSDLFDSRKGKLEALKLTFMPIEAGSGLFLYSLNCANHNVGLKKAFLHRVLLSTNEDIIWRITSGLTGKYDDGILCMLALWVLQQFNDWRCDGSAQEVVCHQNGPHWSTVLLGAYEGQSVERIIIDALGVGALAFGSHRGLSSDKAKTYLAFLRKVQDPANSNETTAKRLVESLGKMIMGVEWTNIGKRSIEDTSCLLIEIIQTIKRFLTSRGRIIILEVHEDTRNALWCGLEYAVKIAATRPWLAQKLEFDDLILNTLDWRRHCKGYNYLPDMENHPRVVAWLINLVGGKHSPTWRECLSSITGWLPIEPSLEQAWMDGGLGVQLVEAFRSSENDDDRRLVTEVLRCVVGRSVMPESWCQVIVEAGIIPLVVDVMLRIDSDPDKFGSDSPRMVIDVVRLIWKDTGRQYHTLDDWTSDEMVLAIKQAISSSPQRWATHGEYWNDLANFVKHIRVQRGSSALIARNFDVAANRVCPQEAQMPDWEYCLYGEWKLPCCVFRNFTNEGMI